jgi:hypothetical protein
MPRLPSRPLPSVLSSLLVGALAASEAPKVDFHRDIEPIFRATCYTCHGLDKQEGKLRMDSREALLKGGEDGAGMVPGDGAKSAIVLRSQGAGDGARMPKKKAPLARDEIALISRWIDEGASWPATAGADSRHWAYVMPKAVMPPAVTDRAWVRTPIDAFVLARLEKEGLQPEAEAARETLIRRVSLDLTGLPPSPAEVDAFVADRAPDAYEKVVDRLLASPHYGERWARLWLDLARYADTNGYEKDQRRTMWRWRDWVIDACNADLPFDQFTIRQLAGDLLPDATLDDRIATGFHRNTLINQEDGVDQGEMRWNMLIDRVNTTATVWLATSVGCAQCHDHKYDPITQKEFYQLLAFFESSDEPQIPAPTPEDAQRRGVLEAELAKARAELGADTPALAKAQADWERRQGTVAAWTVADGKATAAEGTKLAKRKDGAWLATKPAASDTYTLTFTASGPVRALQLDVLTDPSLPSGGPGAAGNGNFVLSEIRLAASGKPVALSAPSADFSQDGWPVTNAIDGKDDTGWAVQPETGKPHSALFRLAEAVSGELTVTLVCRSPHAQHLIGCFRLSTTGDGDPQRGLAVPADIAAILAKTQRSDGERKRLGDHWRAVAPEFADARARVAKAEEGLRKSPQTTAMVLQEKANAGRPSAIVHPRGGWLAKGEPVQADVPKALPPLPDAEHANRLSLARWLVSGDNPLTARVIANRYWEQFFGRGIVETSEDFGLKSGKPSHPELLDWLAREFVAQGWSVKKLHRLIVTSATYRQGARVTAAKLERDPYNRLLSHASRQRLEAELVRDNALAIAGLLSAKVGGPSVMPFQPDGVWNVPYSGDRWSISEGDDRHRRGIYTFWRRSSPYPSFISFDAPSREFCTLRRARTNTPLQALTVLNDPVYVEAAQALARRMAADGGDAPAQRLTLGFRLCTGRAPAAGDLAPLTALYERQAKRYGDDHKAATAFAGGDAGSADVAKLAALTTVANVLLNLDETITKE